MLSIIQELLDNENSFAFETTLSTKSYTGLIKKAKEKGYEIILLFLILDSQELAIKRVETRVKEGGHNIPKEVIKRRFENGLVNLFNLYIPIVNKWIIIDNSGENFEVIGEGFKSETIIKNKKVWSTLKEKYYENK